MKTSLSWIFGLLIFACLQTASAWEKVFDFEHDDPDFPPQGMVIETPPGSKPLVLVQRDVDKPAKPQYLLMRGSAFPGVNSLICVAWFTNLQNGSIQVKLKHGGEPEVARTAGLVWRYQSAGDTYSLEWDSRKSSLALSVTAEGKRKILEKEKVVFPPNTWANLSVTFQGQEIRCEVNGKLIFKTSDSKLSEAGKVGLLLQSDVPICFDDFRIRGDD